MAVLTVTGGALDVRLTGPDAGRFSTSFDPVSGRVTIVPAAVFDAEALGVGAAFVFSVSVRTADGWVALAAQYTVSLIDLDDTPPEGLRFLTGGAVLANDVGAEVGQLVADDPDTAGELDY
ncbi:hypothetical protein, partial [Aphanothece microscopica]|uniref:hypothetical protein n=1 Tax=Aphanothece microscopica TaxID=1049561 RepID=UPI003984AE27